VLGPTAATIRLFLHVLAACVWVGGQLVLGALVGPLRAASADAPRAAARAFNRIAWPAFAVLLATGIWNLLAIDMSSTSTAYQITLMLKLLMVAVTGIGAAFHAGARSKLALALGGAMSGLGGLLALFLGVLLHAH
jgi:putative copper export protein